MIRARFQVAADDYRPVNWPVKHPYWCSGSGGDYWIVISYADNVEEILQNWPEATEIETEEAKDYTFTDRFPRPTWFRDRLRIEVSLLRGLELHEEATRICRELKVDVVYTDEGCDTLVPYIGESK